MFRRLSKLWLLLIIFSSLFFVQSAYGRSCGGPEIASYNWEITLTYDAAQDAAIAEVTASCATMKIPTHKSHTLHSSHGHHCGSNIVAC